MAEQMLSIQDANAMVRLLGAIRSYRTGVSEQEKFDFNKQQKLRTQARQDAQYEYGRWNDLIEKSVGPEREHLIKRLEERMDQMPTSIQDELRAKMKLTQFGPKAQLYNRWLKTHPEPERMPVENRDMNMLATAQDDFAWNRWKFQSDVFQFGAQGQKRKDLINMDQDTWAYENPDTGIVSLLPRSVVERNDQIKKAGGTYDTIMQNGGLMETQDHGTFAAGRNTYSVKSMLHVPTGKKFVKQDLINKAPAGAPDLSDEAETLFSMMDIKFSGDEADMLLAKGNSGNAARNIQHFRDLVDDGTDPQEAAQITYGSMAPQYTWRVMDEKNMEHFKSKGVSFHYSRKDRGTNFTLIPIPGTRRDLPGLPANGQPTYIKAFYDEAKDMYYSFHGIPLGNSDVAEQWASITPGQPQEIEYHRQPIPGLVGR